MPFTTRACGLEWPPIFFLSTPVAAALPLSLRSAFAALGAASARGGQSEGAIPGTGLSPYPDDYLFFRTSTGYGKRKAADPKVYDFVTSVRSSIGCEWQLYRRKTTPHR